MSPDQKGIETPKLWDSVVSAFTMSPDQKGIETVAEQYPDEHHGFTMSPDQKGIETGWRTVLPETFSCSQ